MHFTTMFALGAFFTVIGAGLFVSAFVGPKQKETDAPLKKAEQRAQQERRTEAGKLRIAGLFFTIFGVVLMLLS